MITQTTFSICKADFSEFAYMDMGYVKFDKKMPRRSGTFKTIEEAQAALDKFRTKYKVGCLVDIKRLQNTINLYAEDVKNGVFVDYVAKKVKEKKKIERSMETVDFAIVKVTIEAV